MSKCAVVFLGTPALLGSGVALGATCLSGFDGNRCDTDGTDGSTADDICQVSGTQVTCELDRIASTDPANAYAVRVGSTIEVF